MVVGSTILRQQRKTKLRKQKIATTEVSSFKKELYRLMYNQYKKKHDLKHCVVLLGNLKNLDTKEFTPTKKLRRYLHNLKEPIKTYSISKTKHSVCDSRFKASLIKSTRLGVSADKNVKSVSKVCSKRKSSCNVFTKCKFKNKKVIFEKNLVISDDSESDTENYSVGINSKILPKKTTIEKPLEIDKDEDKAEFTHVKYKSKRISKICGEGHSSITLLQKPAKSVNGKDNDSVNKSSERCSSIIQLAFEKALSTANDVGDQHNSNENYNATKTSMERLGSQVQDGQLYCSKISAGNEKVLHIFGNRFVQQYKCIECKETFDDSFKLKRHTMVHKMKSDKIEKKPTLSCYLCMRKFFDRNSLWSHMRNHTSKQAMYRCKNCNTEFKASRDLCAHKSVCSGSRNSSNKQVATASKSSDSPEATLKYRCNICKRKFADVLQMRRHKKLHNAQNLSSSGEHTVTVTTSPRTAVLLDKIITTTSSKQNTATTSSNCSRLNNIKSNINTKQLLENNQKDQTEKKTLENVLQKEKTTIDATSSTNVIISDSSTLAELKPKFKCCQKIFGERNELFLHMKQQSNTASGIINCNPAYVCNVCSTEFNERLEWYQHCKTKHKNYYGQKMNKSAVKIRKPRYACGTCYMKFDSISKLKEHKLTKHLSINSLQKTSSRDARVSLNDLRTEFEQLFCTLTTNHASQQNSGDNDEDDDLIIVEDNGSDISESESHKDNYESQTDCEKKMEEEKVDSSNCNEDEKTRINVDLSAELPNVAVTYRCDICDDVFEDHEMLLEHEAFHKEIEIPTEKHKENKKEQRKSLNMPNLTDELISNAEQKIFPNKITSSDAPTQQKPQQETSINHINIAVNLPSMVNNAELSIGTKKRTDQNIAELDKNVANTMPQQNLVTILIGNSGASVIPSFNVFSQSPVLYQPQSQNSCHKTESNVSTKSSNSNLQGESINQTSTDVTTDDRSSVVEACKTLVISDVRSLAESPQTSAPSSTIELTSKDKNNTTIVLSNVRKQTNPPPLRLIVTQCKKLKNNEELQQPPKNVTLIKTKDNANLNKAVFAISLPETHTTKTISSASNKILVVRQNQTVNTPPKRLELNKQNSIRLAVPAVLPLLTSTVGDTQKSSLTKQVVQTSTISQNQHLANVTVVSQPVIQNNSSQIDTLNQIMIVNRGANLNNSQILPASSLAVNNSMDRTPQNAVINEPVNNQNIVSNFSQHTAVLTQVGTKNVSSDITSTTTTTTSYVSTADSNKISRLGVDQEKRVKPATIVGMLESALRHGKSKKQKFLKSTGDLKILPKSSANNVIVLSDDSNDESTLESLTKTSRSELPSGISNRTSFASQELQTNKYENLLEMDIRSALSTGIKYVPNTAQKKKEEILKSCLDNENEAIDVSTTNSDNPQSTQDIDVSTGNDQNKVSSISPNKQSYLTTYETFLSDYAPTPAQICSRSATTPRIFVRNIKELMDPQCKLFETETKSTSQVSIDKDLGNPNNIKSTGKDDDANESKNSVSLPTSSANERKSSSSSQQSEQEQTKKHKSSKFEPTKCNDCNVLFKKQRSFRRHARIGRYKYRCHMCDYHICTRRWLKVHYNSEHKIEHICWQCLLVCDSSRDLTLHFKSHNVHTDLQQCTKTNSKNLEHTLTKQIEQKTTNLNQDDTSCKKTTQATSDLPILCDELSILEDTPVSSQETLNSSEIALIIDETNLL